MSFPACKFFRSEQGCKFGNKCRYKHSDPPPISAFDHQHNQHDHNGSVRRLHSAGTSTYPQGNSSFSPSGKYEASVRNTRYQGYLPFHGHPSKESCYNEGQVKDRRTPDAAEALYLEEKFQGLKTAENSEERIQQRPQRKLCHFFARNGNCCFGSKCRFEHAQPYEKPPRFQQDRDGPGSDKHQSAGPQFGRPGYEDRVRYSRHPNEGTASYRAANLSQNGSAKAALPPRYGKPPGQSGGNQDPESDPDPGKISNRNEETKQVIHQNPDKICQFFLRGWCMKGRRCRFLHPRGKPKSAKEVDPEVQHEGQEEKSTPSFPEEHAEDSSSSQVTEENSHNEPSPKPPAVLQAKTTRPTYVAQGTKKYRRDEVDDVEGSRLRRTEIEQLIKRFPKSKVKVNRDCAEYFQCVVSFSPTDPDWPFDVKIFQLQVDVPSDYPFEMMTITLPAEQDLPETVRRYLEVSIEEWLDDKERQLADNSQVELVFRPFLRWLDRNIEDVVTEGLKQMKRELVAQAAGLQFISAKELQKQYPGQSSDPRDDDDDDDDEDSDDEDDDTGSETQDEDTSTESYESGEEEACDEAAEEDQNEEKKGRKSLQDKTKLMLAEPERRGTEVSLKNLQLKESAATLYFEKICLLIQCERCKSTSEFMASPGRVNMVQCGQCSQTQTATYRPAMAHHFSAVIGYLDLNGCLPYDLILQNCSAVTACMHCSKDTRSGAVVAGQPQDQWCRVCHHKLRVATDGVRFTQLEPSRPIQSLKGSVKVVVPTRKRIPKDPAIQEGKPLPNFGTCKHYKKSYRWLRFPCCGKCYPCDVCHDSKEDHEMTFANRMICGFCCKEQPFAMEKPCKGCDMNLTRVHTKHWEGGQGCRDKISMSRNDKHKYRNTTKTTSKHSQKVKDMQSKKKTKLRHT